MVKTKKMIAEDREEMDFIIKELKLKAYVGFGNKCPKCKRAGSFGSILKYECESGNTYLICGWCGTINLIEIAKEDEG